MIAWAQAITTLLELVVAISPQDLGLKKIVRSLIRKLLVDFYSCGGQIGVTRQRLVFLHC